MWWGRGGHVRVNKRLITLTNWLLKGAHKDKLETADMRFG